MSVLQKKIGEVIRDLFSNELKNSFSNYPGVFFINYSKLKSAEMTQLRKDLKGVGARVLVAKNSYVKRVLEGSKKPAESASMIDGPTALVFVKDDPVGVSKVLMEFEKAHEVVGIRGGFLSERVMTLDDIKLISKLSSMQAVYQQVASVLNAPINKLATSLNQIIVKLVYALKATSDKKK